MQELNRAVQIVNRRRLTSIHLEGGFYYEPSLRNPEGVLQMEVITEFGLFDVIAMFGAGFAAGMLFCIFLAYTVVRRD